METKKIARTGDGVCGVGIGRRKCTDCVHESGLGDVGHTAPQSGTGPKCYADYMRKG